MSLLSTFKTLRNIEETAAGDVCGAAMPLFAQLVSNTKQKKQATVLPRRKEPKKPSLGLKEALAGAPDSEPSDTPDFDQAGVIANLKKLERKETVNRRDAVAFGLEDDDGNTVKVWIKREQAKDFERQLTEFLSTQEHDEDNKEIAEILYMLKNQFDIIDVEWPEVEEDEEQQTQIAGGDGSQDPNQDPNADPNAAAGGDVDLGGDLGAAGGDDSQASSMLQQVIDMMKADAEARKAEAEARKAEARSKEADLAVKQAMTKVKQEEQFLDMESYNKAQKDQDKEAKRLAQLAQWKHRMNNGDDDDEYGSIQQRSSSPSSIEDEESVFRRPAYHPAPPVRKTGGIRGRVSPKEIADFIIGRVKN